MKLGWKSVSKNISLLMCIAAFAACDDDDTLEGQILDEVVDVTLDEFVIEADRTFAFAGDVRFEATNIGLDIHELVIIRTNLLGDELPVIDHQVDQTDPALTVVEEVENIQPGETVSFTVNLDVGPYVLICNRLSFDVNGTPIGHYENGMFLEFDVL